jgi:hypothetical protein
MSPAMIAAVKAQDKHDATVFGARTTRRAPFMLRTTNQLWRRIMERIAGFLR